MLLRFRVEYHCLLSALCREYIGSFCTFRDKYFLTSFALCFHLLFHCVLNFFWRNDVFKLYAVYFYSPRVCRFVERRSHAGVYYVARCKRVVEFKLAYDVTERCRREIFYRCLGALDSVCVKLAVGYLIKYYGVDTHFDIVFCYNVLRIEIGYLLHKGYLASDLVKKRELYVYSRVPGRVICSESFDYIRLRLGNYADIRYCDHNYNDQYDSGYNERHNVYLSF